MARCGIGVRQRIGGLQLESLVQLVTKQSFLGKEDHELQARLKGEYSGILNWALEGHVRLHRRGHFLPGPSSLEAMQDLGELASPIKAFVSEWCNLAGEVPCSSLYAEYQGWCSKNGHHASSITVFGRDLGAAYPAIKRRQRRDGDARQGVYTGLSLKPECA